MLFKSSFQMVLLFVLTCTWANAQDTNTESRLMNLEEYVQSIPSSLADYSDNMQQNLREYTKGLEESLDVFSKDLKHSIEERLKFNQGNIIVLSPLSDHYQKIETNTGVFFISIRKLERIKDGYRLHLSIGNPNYADYKDFKLHLAWGSRWKPNKKESQELWRSRLKRAEYSFNGRIVKGMWNDFQLEINPANVKRGNLYIDCEMEVISVELQYPK